MKNLKLNNVNSSMLNNYEMRNIRGGQMATSSCACACKYAKSGGSSTNGNGNANNARGLCSPGTERSGWITLDELMNMTIIP